MTKTEILAILKKNRNERGMKHWKDRFAKDSQLKSFGIGLTQLRKIAKQVGRDHRLAQKLWQSDVYDAKVLGLLIDDPKQITREQAEQQVEELEVGMLAHVFASCDATLAKTPFAPELAGDWMNSKDSMRRQCGYTLLYELSKKNIKAMDDAYFMNQIADIESKIEKEEMMVKVAMAGALLGIGKRNILLNSAAVKIAKRLGPVPCGEGNCEPFDLYKHLTSEYVRKKFARK